jgi:hypothetical protein
MKLKRMREAEPFPGTLGRIRIRRRSKRKRS